MTRTRHITAGAALAAMALLAGCRQDMHNQPKFYPQRGTTFYADGRSVRPQVEETVAREQLHEDAYFYTGVEAGKEGDGLPLPLTPELMARGQERYNVYCTACHSRVGNGDGMIVQRGYKPAGNFHTDRLRNAPLGHFFNVMTNGYGAMPDYAAQLTPADRWAVAAYIRALQLSQAAPATDAGSAKVEGLAEIAKGKGLPPGFAQPMQYPGTAVWGDPATEEDMTSMPSPTGKEAPAMKATGDTKAGAGSASSDTSSGSGRGASQPAAGATASKPGSPMP